MDGTKKKELELWAYKIRRTALKTIQTAGSGHIDGSRQGGQGQTCPFEGALYAYDVCDTGTARLFPGGASVHLP